MRFGNDVTYVDSARAGHELGFLSRMLRRCECKELWLYAVLKNPSFCPWFLFLGTVFKVLAVVGR